MHTSMGHSKGELSSLYKQYCLIDLKLTAKLYKEMSRVTFFFWPLLVRRLSIDDHYIFCSAS